MSFLRHCPDKVDVIVTYVPVESSGNRVSIYKSKESKIIFSIIGDDGASSVISDVDWKKNTWHRICCTYRANSDSDTMRMFIDGQEVGAIRFGANSAVFGSGLVFGQRQDQSGATEVDKYKIRISDDFKIISIGSDNIGYRSAMARMDNIKFSREFEV